ncbi:MAG: ComEC/Rec2 family competence protein, partial [Planctomycetota bacterium]
VQLLALAGLLLLAVFPLDIYRAGFQLSFVTVLALILLAGPARRWALATVRKPDDAAALATPDGRVVRLADWCDRKLIDAFAAALIAWLASMPLVAMHFGQFHLWSIPASVLAGPLVVASLLGGVVKVVLTLLVPEAATWWATMASWPVEAMRSTVAWFSRLPLADVPLPTPPLWLVIATYLALVGIWLTLRKWPVRRRPPASLVWGLRASVVLAAGFLFVMPVLGATTPTLLTKPLRVTLLAVGAGQAAVVEQPNGRVTMIDAGSISLAEPWESCIGPFLRSRGIARIDRLVLSHANLDHYNGAADLIERYGIREVVVGPGFESDAQRDGVGRALLAAIGEADVPMRIVQRGDVVPMGSATSFQVHWPPAEVDGLTPNDASIVATLQHEGQRVLFTGDLQADGMTGAMGNDLPDVDVLVAPHHGSTETPTPDFVEACLPEWVVSSDGRRLSQKQRRLPDVIGDRPLLRTGRDGAILIDLSREGVTVESFLDSERRTLTVAE